MSSSAILAVDTAYQCCSAAVLAADGRSAWRAEHIGSKHAERILSMIEETLAEAGLAKEDIKLVAFGAGPGSFTGLRVACGTAQGIAWALGTKVAPVGNLEADAAAAAAAASLPAGARIAVLNDARMQEAYGALYEAPAPGERPKELAAPEIVRPAEALSWLEKGGAQYVCGSAIAAYAGVLRVPEGTAELPVPDSMILTLARLGLLYEKEGLAVMPSLAAPLYVRDRVALTMAERARGERL
jgi:tRNA threonylcarbamoyladenosine biosynthesis protein TsaB